MLQLSGPTNILCEALLEEDWYRITPVVIAFQAPLLETLHKSSSLAQMIKAKNTALEHK